MSSKKVLKDTEDNPRINHIGMNSSFFQ